MPVWPMMWDGSLVRTPFHRIVCQGARSANNGKRTKHKHCQPRQTRPNMRSIIKRNKSHTPKWVRLASLSRTWQRSVVAVGLWFAWYGASWPSLYPEQAGTVSQSAGTINIDWKPKSGQSPKSSRRGTPPSEGLHGQRFLGNEQSEQQPFIKQFRVSPSFEAFH